jgi:hypothetical protein
MVFRIWGVRCKRRIREEGYMYLFIFDGKANVISTGVDSEGRNLEYK